MHQSRFDIAIAGDSLTARIAAALLAKHGKRLLLLASPLPRDYWQYSSFFVERLLGVLGGRSCFSAYPPFQVLSKRARVTICPELPLAEELAREFGAAGPAVGKLLAELEQTGRLLEELCWEYGGLPTGGVRESARWHWLCLRRKLSLSAMAAPLHERLRLFPEGPGEWLRDLFQGLALKPLEALTLADGALLWTYASRQEGIAADELNQLLHKRFEQFHGIEAPLANTAAFEHQHGQWHGTLQGGKPFQAQQLIVADLGHEFTSRHFPLPAGLPAPNRLRLTSALDGRLSPLLARRVIAGGALPLRLAIEPTSAGLIGQIGTVADGDDRQIRQQLEAVLPFASYTLDQAADERGPAGTTGSCSPLFGLPIRLGSHLWCADDSRLLPHLGVGGAAMLAWTLVRHLDPAIIAHGR